MLRLLWLALMLSACASHAPRYQTSIQYEPPQSAEGMACMEACTAKLSTCQQSCNTQYQQCVQQLAPQIDAAYAQALQRYQTDLEHYRMALEQYEMRRAMNYRFYRQRHDIYWQLPYEPLPFAPIAPRRDLIATQTKQQQCDNSCACSNLSDNCFLACGAKRISETRCIANCPDQP